MLLPFALSGKTQATQENNNMIAEDNSWQALMQPGDAENFFDIPNFPPFEPQATAQFSLTNALWFSEFARLIYRQENDELAHLPKDRQRPNDFRRRRQILNERHWDEIKFYNPGSDKEDTQAALFKNGAAACVVFRGTLGIKDFITDSKFVPVQWEGRGHVHEGFKLALESVWPAIRSDLKGLALPVFFTGHSLGAAVATLAAAECLRDSELKSPAALYTFGSPRVGDTAFGLQFDGFLHVRIVDHKDVVATVPPVLPVIGNPTFKHVGELHLLDCDGSLHLFPPNVDVAGHGGFLAKLRALLTDMNETYLDLKNSPNTPPAFLADHAPVNYTARLAKGLGNTR